jgi:hypothetical protein
LVRRDQCAPNWTAVQMEPHHVGSISVRVNADPPPELPPVHHLSLPSIPPRRSSHGRPLPLAHRVHTPTNQRSRNVARVRLRRRALADLFILSPSRAETLKSADWDSTPLGSRVLRQPWSESESLSCRMSMSR